MSGPLRTYSDVGSMLAERRPAEPVYCIYPQVYVDTAREFVAGFPGRVLYAVKANDHPEVVRLLNAGGVQHFDCASLPEIELVHRQCPGATAYFMIPARLRGSARDAQDRFGVRHFMIDHANGLPPLADEIDMSRSVVFARMATQHASAMQELSSKFGAPPEQVPGLLEAIASHGAEPALAFNVGTGVTSPDAYSYAIELAAEVLDEAAMQVRLVDIGGGYADRSLGNHAGLWMAREAEACGLAPAPHFLKGLEPDYAGPQHNEYKGFYRAMRRKIVRDVEPVVHVSVRQRWQDPAVGYKSEALRGLLKRLGEDWDGVEIIP